MRADRTRVVTASAAVAAVLLGAFGFGCGAEKEPYRIGVIADCEGLLHPLRGDELAAAQLPLIQRGASHRGSDPADGITTTEVAGRPVKLVTGCSEVGEFSTVTQEARRLIENEHVDALVAGTWSVDEVVLRTIAQRHPDVTVVPVVHGPREVTLGRAPRNLYRVAADEVQGTAGLGTYAYRRLGWRTAAVAYADWISGWDPRDAFVREFCALGGRIASQVAVTDFDPVADVAKVPRDVDGVAVFAGQPFDPSRFLDRLARRVGEPSRRMVVGAGITAEPDWLRNVARPLAGVVGSSYQPATMGGSRLAYRAAYARAFPGRSKEGVDGAIVGGFHNSVAAIVGALQRAHGDPARVRAQLSGLDADLLDVPTRLDANRQAVVPAYLVRIVAPRGVNAPVRLAPVRTIPGVDQSIGGLLDAGRVPTSGPLACRRAAAPPWAD